jgi:hypothetical protein
MYSKIPSALFLDVDTEEGIKPTKAVPMFESRRKIVIILLYTLK